MGRGRASWLACIAVAMCCVDWAFTLPRSLDRLSKFGPGEATARIQPGQNRIGLRQLQDADQGKLFRSAWWTKCLQASFSVLLGLVVATSQVLAQESATVTGQKRGEERSIKAPPNANDEIVRKTLEAYNKLQSDPESFWDGDAAGPEAEGASYGVSRGMMKNMRAAMKKRQAAGNQ
mmetsp:Transcript_94581/g.131406  ORF Transcript_94581/g.131406 Transcript_94581/m.131406 type:complete len:177 (-) Transcript_94581:41-571(-)